VHFFSRLWYNAVVIALTQTKWCVRQSARGVVSKMVTASHNVLMEVIECLRDKILAVPHPVSVVDARYTLV